MSMLSLAMDAVGHWGWGAGAWWPIFPLFWLAFWAVLIFAVFRLFRARGWGYRGYSAEEVLGERYARGEITVDEYRERLRVLKDNR
jgi:putative membrane protein